MAAKRLCGVAAGIAFACAAAGFGQPSAGQPGALGVFEGQSDVGVVQPAGTASFDAATGVYTVAAAGWDMWAANDAFHMVWKKMSGDVSLTAHIQLAAPSAGSHPNRKAFLMFRQTLDRDSMYAHVAVHGTGMTALQYRHAKGDTTQTVTVDISTPQTVRLEKRGDTITLFVSIKGEPLHQVGATVKLHFTEPFYVGMGMCSHRDGAPEKVAFSQVELTPLAAPQNPAPKALYSTLRTIAIDNDMRFESVVLTGKKHMEAPNWSRDGKTLIFDQDGRMWSVPVAGGEPSAIDVGNATGCNGSHGLSPDGKLLAITCMTPDHPGNRVYTVPAEGGTPRMVTPNPDSYFHSWSPDGKTIAFARGAHGGVSILSIPVEGSQETSLTTGIGTDDDPDYSPDGQYIYFNSDRAGGMEIFRMRPDGSHPEQMTFDDKINWTAHPSPDGKSVLMISFAKGTTGHPTNKDVTLRILDVETKKVRDLVEIVGGQGTENVPNWSPDGKRFAFVSYQMLPAQETGSSE